MATYNELYTVWMDGDNGLQNRVAIAVLVAAVDIAQESTSTPNHAERYRWAAKAMTDPTGEARRFFSAMLAFNKDLTMNQILSASDTAIQSQVNGAVNAVALRDQAIGI